MDSELAATMTVGVVGTLFIMLIWTGILMLIRLIFRAILRRKKPVRIGFFGIPAGILITAALLTLTTAYGRSSLQGKYGANAVAMDFTLLLIIALLVVLVVRAIRARQA